MGFVSQAAHAIGILDGELREWQQHLFTRQLIISTKPFLQELLYGITLIILLFWSLAIMKSSG
jgi:hypothetical protein